MLADQDLISIQEVREKVGKAWTAWQIYRSFTQQRIDDIVERTAGAARMHARRLAELAVEETGYGNANDKLTKNMLAADLLPKRMRGLRTVGILREIPEERLIEIGVPVGVIAAVLPTTNPTSTAIYKILISLKAGNAIVLGPHPHAKRCTCETAEVMHRAAVDAGAPEGIIGCIAHTSVEGTNALMRHEKTALILSTGGHAIVRAAYSSGKPALGVGPGNVPVMLERTADIADAVAKVVAGKTFDYGTLCSSEQALVAEESLRERVMAELKLNHGFFCNAAQTDALGRLLLTPNWTVNPKCVGQPAPKIARMAGFEAPDGASVLVVELHGVGREHPLSAEKLSPVLSLYFVKDFAAGVEVCRSLLRFGGLGHTCVIHSNDEARIREYALEMPAMRVLVNTSAPQGSTGITTNVFPAMTLGCGAAAGNSTSDNIGPLNLINVKRLAWAVPRPGEAFSMPAAAGSVKVDRATLVAAVEKYLGARGVETAAVPSPAAAVVDRFLSRRREAPAVPVPGAPPPAVVDFVCEDDVRNAIAAAGKIHIGPKTIITPSARDLGERYDILVLAQR